jgi:membrane dipeptidase
MPPKGNGAGARRKDGSGYSIITISVLAIGAITTAVLSYLGFPFSSSKIDESDYEGRVKHILATTPLIDGHNDLPYLLRIELQNKIYDSTEFNFWDGLASHTDLKRLQEGRVGGQFWSVFVEVILSLQVEIPELIDYSAQIPDILMTPT